MRKETILERLIGRSKEQRAAQTPKVEIVGKTSTLIRGDVGMNADGGGRYQANPQGS